MFGGRYPTEEYTPKRWVMLPSRQADAKIVDGEELFDGSYRRVPASDNVAIPRDMRATAEVHADGKPIDETSRRLIAEQNAEAEKAKRTTKDTRVQEAKLNSRREQER